MRDCFGIVTDWNYLTEKRNRYLYLSNNTMAPNVYRPGPSYFFKYSFGSVAANHHTIDRIHISDNAHGLLHLDVSSHIFRPLLAAFEFVFILR